MPLGIPKVRNPYYNPHPDKTDKNNDDKNNDEKNNDGKFYPDLNPDSKPLSPNPPESNPDGYPSRLPEITMPPYRDPDPDGYPSLPEFCPFYPPEIKPFDPDTEPYFPFTPEIRTPYRDPDPDGYPSLPEVWPSYPNTKPSSYPDIKPSYPDTKPSYPDTEPYFPFTPERRPPYRDQKPFYPDTERSPKGKSELGTGPFPVQNSFTGPPQLPGVAAKPPNLVINTEVQWIDLYEAIYSRGIIFLSGEIKAELANMLVGLMIYFGLKNPTDDNDMFMFISSPGGSIRHGTAIFDTMQTVTPRVHTVGLGLVASMAALILSGGEPTSRVALPHTRIMIHQPICTYMELFYNENLMQWNEMQKLRRQVVEMYMAKTGQVRRIVTKDLERDYFMSAIEAKNYGTFGIVDSVGSWQ